LPFPPASSFKYKAFFDRSAGLDRLRRAVAWGFPCVLANILASTVPTLRLTLNRIESDSILKGYQEGTVYYETTFIVNPDVSQENTQSITDNLVERIETAGGRVVKREYWGSRSMAYSINKRKRGHYMFLVTDGGASAINALESAIRLDERIVRFLSVRSETFNDQPSPLARRNKPVATEAVAVADDSAEAAPEATAEASTEASATAEATTEAPAEEAAAEAPVESKESAA